MDKFKKISTGGLPLRLDDFIWEQGSLDASNYGIYQALQADLLAYGTDFIVEGCTYSAPNITAGWIMLDSELMRVNAHAGTTNFFEKITTFDARGDKTFKDSASQSTYEIIRGVLSAGSGSLDITSALRLEDKIIQLLATSTQKFAALNMPLATETTVGARELSTQAETDAGTDDITIVTPLKLRTTAFIAAQIPSLPANKITSDTFDPARLPTATTTAIGAVEEATAAELDNGSSGKFPDCLTINNYLGALKTKVIDIGDWDMDIIGSVSVAHGLTIGTIRAFSAVIIDDASIGLHDIGHYAGTTAGAINASGGVMVLSRTASGFFDGTGFSTTPFNRGWIVIKYSSL